MSRFIFTLLFVITAFTPGMAQYSQRSVLEVRMNDHEPIVVSVDDRYYNKHGRTVTIGNLPKGWHDLRVYEYLEYKKGGGRAKLLYTGRIRIDAGTVTHCVIDRQTRRMRTRTMDIEDAYHDYDQPDDNERYNDNDRQERNSNVLNNEDLNDLKARADDRITDTEKLKLMKSVLEKRTYYSVQVRTMMGWLAFESSKLDFAKWSYERALDKQDYWKLEDVFSFTSSKDEFNQYVNAR